MLLATLGFFSVSSFFESIWLFIVGFAMGALTLWTWEFFVFWVPLCLIGFRYAVGNKYWPTGVILFLATVFFLVTGAFHPIMFALEHPFWAILLPVGYLAAGLTWVCFKWVKYIEKVRSRRYEVMVSFLGRYQTVGSLSLSDEKLAEEKITEENFDQWVASVKTNGRAPEDGPRYLNRLYSDQLDSDSRYSEIKSLGTATEAPKWEQHRKDYWSAFAYWPLDVLHFFLGEFLHDVWEMLSNAIRDWFNNYARRRTFKPFEE
jgi:hypothetical protein